MRYTISTKSHFVYPAGKPIIPHLFRYQGLAVVYYGFALGCLGSGPFSAFAQLGYEIDSSIPRCRQIITTDLPQIFNDFQSRFPSKSFFG